MVAIILNEVYLKENLVDITKELEASSSDAAKRSDGDSIEQDNSNIGD